jgi:hypothetical protein
MTPLINKHNIVPYIYFKGRVSRDKGGLQMVSVARYIVLDIPALYLFSILMSPSYAKFNICNMYASPAPLFRLPPPRKRVIQGEFTETLTETYSRGGFRIQRNIYL